MNAKEAESKAEEAKFPLTAPTADLGAIIAWVAGVRKGRGRELGLPRRLGLS